MSATNDQLNKIASADSGGISSEGDGRWLGAPFLIFFLAIIGIPIWYFWSTITMAIGWIWNNLGFTLFMVIVIVTIILAIQEIWDWARPKLSRK